MTGCLVWLYCIFAKTTDLDMKLKTTTLSIVAILLLTISFSSQAQTRVGGGFAWGSEIEDFGINLRGDISVTDNISLVPGFTFFFTESNLTWWELSANGHWHFQGEPTGAYALVGLNFTRVEVDLGPFGEFGDTEVGLNVGGGYNFNLPGPVDPFGEARFVIGDADQLVLALGILVSIN